VKHHLVVVGGSWGGMRAVEELLDGLGDEVPAAIVVALHRGPTDDPRLARLLQRHTALPVREAEDKDALRPGHVYVAPADYHTLVEADGTLGLSTEERVRYARPSIDVLFRSAADAYRERCVGVVLSGANDDGADGLRRIKELGGVTVVQEPGTAERSEMPAAAIAAADADAVLPLAEIGSYLRGLLLETGPATSVEREPEVGLEPTTSALQERCSTS
jgi:two-component system, chemotaxis family, protein-glutamate methylesterase/glutaminase